MNFAIIILNNIPDSIVILTRHGARVPTMKYPNDETYWNCDSMTYNFKIMKKPL